MIDSRPSVVIVRELPATPPAQQSSDNANAVRYALHLGQPANPDEFYKALYSGVFGDDCYGHNLDALHDVGGDVIYSDPGTGKCFDWEHPNDYTVVVLSGLDALVLRCPDFCRDLLGILDSCSRGAQEESAELTWVIQVSEPAYEILSRLRSDSQREGAT